jgi:mannose-6-phosphate isomerase-like protein (cupin superfamily)
MTNPLPKGIVTALPADHEVVRAFGCELIIHLGADGTGGRYSMFTSVQPPGVGPPPHYHRNEDEWFLVLDGRAEFFRDGAWFEVPEGTALFVPKGVVHAFRNPGDRPQRILVHTAPGGVETFFRRCAEEFAKPGGPDMARIIQISNEHGIEYV